jgi:hypothetical protein
MLWIFYSLLFSPVFWIVWALLGRRRLYVINHCPHEHQAGQQGHPLPMLTFRDGTAKFLGCSPDETRALAVQLNVGLGDEFTPDFFVRLRNVRLDWGDHRRAQDTGR